MKKKSRSQFSVDIGEASPIDLAHTWSKLKSNSTFFVENDWADAVWPDVRTKVAQTFPKSSQKYQQQFFFKKQGFRNSPQSHQKLVLLLEENLSPRTFKTCPIWSRWSRAKAPTLVKKNSCPSKVDRKSVCLIFWFLCIRAAYFSNRDLSFMSTIIVHFILLK